MSTPGEFNPDECPSMWQPGADDEREKKGDKPPKKGKGTKKGGKKPKDQRENPDFDDVPGYESLGFRADNPDIPPNPITGPQGTRPPMTFNESAILSADDCKAALLKHAQDNMCYGSKPAQECNITDVRGVTALHYILETFTEKRSTKKKKKPYKGGSVDGPDNGHPPMPWEIDVKPKKMYADDKIKKEVPHTAKVKKCKDCKGRGWETCDECDGWGRVECDACDGSGERTATNEEGEECTMPCLHCDSGMAMCTDCGGDGRVTCDDCEGYRKLKCFIQLKVKFNNHKDEYIHETTDLPDHLITNVAGIPLFEQELPVVWPIDNYPLPEININSRKFVEKHYTAWPEELIRVQRQVLRGVPVTECDYSWGDDFKSRFWVYGIERQVYAPDYPQQCCCGCAII